LKRFEERFKVKPDQKVRLKEYDPDDTSSYDGKKKDALKEIEDLKEKLTALQEKLYAEKKHALLIVLQGMDGAGKDSTIRLVFDGVDPQGVNVFSFKEPTPEEEAHDFLWRIHKKVPAKGEIAIFNRSHYEGVLVERVHKLVPEEEEKRRYEEIVDFERLLSDEGTSIIKFFLCIDQEEQRKRLEERLKDPTKEWKFSKNDLRERDLWKEYMSAYEAALEKTSTRFAPWYIVPADHKWFRDLLVSRVIVKTLEDMNLKYPQLPKKVTESTKVK